MKHKVGFTVVVVLLGSPVLSHAQDITRLDWLGGCWVQDNGTRRIEETWLSPAGGVMLGVGRTIEAGELRNYEFMRIASVDGRLTFTADPSGQQQASFPMVSQTADGIVFENTAHDFPQRVIYRKLSAHHLQAAIEGPMNGAVKTITFDYTRCP